MSDKETTKNVHALPLKNKKTSPASTDKKRNPTQANLIDFCQANPLSLSASSAAMYKPLKAPSSGTIIAEFYHTDGRIMKIHSPCESVHHLIQAFFQDLKNVTDHAQT